VVVGGFASYFAWRQWRLAREKLRLDLFDKRLAAYNGFLDKVRNDVGDADLTQAQYSEALQRKGTISFLFPAFLRTEFAELERVSGEWAEVDSRWRAIRDKDYPAEEKERGGLAARKIALRDQYDKKLAALPGKVAKVMNFEHIRR
jgi:hypothetical protein